MAHNDNNRSRAGRHSNDHSHLHHHGDIPPSPSHFGFPGSFLAEDLHELLGAIREEHEATGGQHFPGTFSHHSGTNSLSHEPPSDCDGQVTSAHLPGEDAKAQARSERKRSRERQRRSDVNKQFTDLTELLRKIEAEDQASDAETSTGGVSSKASIPVPTSRFSFSPANRVDLIAKTITVLERLHSANQKRKRTVVELQEELERAKKAGEDAASRLKQFGTMYPVGGNNNKIMMMVPMMVSSDVATGTPTAAAFPMHHPFMQHPAAYCPLPQPPPPSTASGSDAASSSHPLHRSSTSPLPSAGVASATSSSSSSNVYPHHQHHASFPPFLSMVPTTAANAAPTPYMFHPGMAQAAMPPMVLHQDHMVMATSVTNLGMHANAGIPQPAIATAPNNNLNTDRSSSSPDASSQQEAKVSSVTMNSGGNLAHCA